MGVGCSVSERSFFLSDVRVMGFKDSTEKMKGKIPRRIAADESFGVRFLKGFARRGFSVDTSRTWRGTFTINFATTS